MTLDLAKLRAETLALIDGTIPGPWFLSDAGAIVRAPDGENDPWLVAEMCGCCGHGTDTSDANARLIAAAPTLAADTLRLLDEIERLTAENARCRDAVMPFDDALCDLSAMLIEAGFWPEMAEEVLTDKEGTTADYQASARNVVEGARIAIDAARAALAEGGPDDR